MKKILSVIICISLLMSSALTTWAYNGEDSVKIMQSLGVMQGDPNGNMRENDLVKRSEFAKMAVLLSAFKNKLSLNSKISVFTDCTADHWAAPYVRVAAENGIIEGYSNGIFGPDDNINYAQAVTIALRLLGYTDADFGNTYPEGQLAMAQSLKLGDGLSKKPEEFMTRLDVAVVLNNMLLTNKKDSGTNYIESINYKIKEDTVIVATNDEDASVAPGKVFTTNGEYSIDSSFDKNLVGLKGSVISDSEGKLLTLIKSQGYADKYSVNAVGSDFVSLVGTKGTLALDCDDGTLSYKGTTKTNFGSLKSQIKTGDVLIVGKDKYGNIDYLISGESDFEGPYTTAQDGRIPADDKDYSSYSVIKNGSTSSFANIKKNDIVYISGTLSTVFVYSKKVSGVYQSATPNMDSPESVTVGGNQYKIESTTAFSKLSQGGYKKGDSIVLLLGREGGVADVLGNNKEISQSAADISRQETNTTNSAYALLNAIGAVDLENGSLLNNNLSATRGEFARMIAMASKERNSVSLKSKLSIFADCTANHPMSPYIKVAAENKYMSAYTDSLFYPDKEINLAEALDASLKLLGYSDTDFSDWPSSQLSIGKQKGLTDGINKTAYDGLTKDEAVKVIYNTLRATNKGGSLKGIEQIGYSYYDDAVIIATNNETSSVGAGKVLTSEGTFSIDSTTFDNSIIGKSGELLIYSGKVQMFNTSPSLYTESTVISAMPGGLMLSDDGKNSTVSVPAGTSVYISGQMQSFSKAASQIAVGDTAYISYDNSRRIKYIYINTSSLEGPFTVVNPSAWYTHISGASQSSKVVKNGVEISASQIFENDILYFSSQLNTAYVYNNKVVGILEGATPSKDAPESVTVSGKNYTLESADVSFINTAIGDAVVLCLGRNGKIAHSYNALQEEVAGYLVGTGTKEFTNANGEKYTSTYASLILADGTKLDCATDSDYASWINRVMSISISGGKAKLTVAAGPGKITGAVNASKLTLGSLKLSPDVKILDVGFDEVNLPSIYKAVYLQRIDGVGISTSEVLYAKTENGTIKELILKDVTGDAFSYGPVISANANLSTHSASGSYVCDVSGSRYTASGGVYANINKGNVVKIASGGGKSNLSKINSQNVSVKDISYGSITLSNGATLSLSDEIVVYKISGSYDYNYIPLSEVIENFKNYSYFSIFTDKPENKGGRVRVITVK